MLMQISAIALILGALASSRSLGVLSVVAGFTAFYIGR